MARNEIYQFYVEGEDEKKVIETLKKDMNSIVSGKVEVLNVIQKEIKTPRIRTLKTGTNVVLIYDTDIDKTDILDKNINQLKSSKHIKRIICIPQVLNLEDELVSATSVRQVIEILGSRTLALATLFPLTTRTSIICGFPQITCSGSHAIDATSILSSLNIVTLSLNLAVISVANGNHALISIPGFGKIVSL